MYKGLEGTPYFRGLHRFVPLLGGAEILLALVTAKALVEYQQGKVPRPVPLPVMACAKAPVPWSRIRSQLSDVAVQLLLLCPAVPVEQEQIQTCP